MSSTAARSSSPRASYPEKTHSARAMPSPLSALPVAADDGLKAAKKQFNQPLSQLQAIFPEWKEDDLLSVLEEAQGNVELAVARISEGYAEQWGDVKHKRDKKALTTATEKRTPAGTPVRSGFSPRGGRGGFSGGRGRGGHGGGRGGSGHHNFTNGHQPSSRGKQNYDFGKPTTTATALTTNGDTRKDPKAGTPTSVEGAAPASVEGAANGLSDPATNAPTETPGTAEPWGTAPKVYDPPKSAAAPPSRKLPGTTSMSWAQIARPPLKHIPPPPPVQQVPTLSAAPPSTSSVLLPSLPVPDLALEPSSTEWENPATVQEPSWDDDPTAAAVEETKEELLRETANGWVPAQPEPAAETTPAPAPLSTAESSPAPAPAHPAPEPKSEPPVSVPTPSVADTISPPPGLATPGTPSSVNASTKSHNRAAFSAAHRNSARFKDQAVILPGNSPSSLSGISFGGKNAAYEKLPVQFGSLTFGGDDNETTSDAKPEPALPTETPAPTATVPASATTSSAPGLAHPQQQQQQPEVAIPASAPTPVSGPLATAPASNGFQPLQLPTQPATTSPSQPTSLSHSSQSTTSLGPSHTSAPSVTQSLGVSGPLSNLQSSLPSQAQTGLSSLGQQPQPSHGLGHAHQQSYGQNSFHQPQQPQPQQPHPQTYETVNLPGLGGTIGGFGHQGPQSQTFRHQESPFYGQQAQEHNSGYGASGINAGGFTPLGHQSQGSFGAPGLSSDFGGYDGQRGVYDNFNGPGTFSGRNMLVHDDIKGLGGLGSHQGNQGGPAGGNQNQYPSMSAPMGNPYTYYSPYYVQNQYYGAPSPAGYGHQPPFAKYPMYGQHQAGSGVQTPPNKPPATGNGNGTQYSSGAGHLHHPQTSAVAGFGDETGGYQGSAGSLGGDFQKYNQGGGMSFLGTMGTGSGSAGVGGVGPGVGPISSQRGTGTSPESTYKGYGAPGGVGVGADKSGIPNVASRGVSGVGLGGGAGGQGGQQGNYYQGSGVSAGGVGGGAGRFGVQNQYGAQGQQQPGADPYYSGGYQNPRFTGWQG